MSHPEQLAFFSVVADANQELISNSRVVEIGAYDVNGTMRRYFTAAAEYVGVDLVEGPGVDVVMYGHEVSDESSSFDIAASGECFEHDPHWSETFTNMIRLTRPGGLVVFTCASGGRPEHGTRRTLIGDSPGTQFEGLDYYRNLTERDFSKLDLLRHFSAYKFWHNSTSFDLYFAGIRSGETEGKPTADLPNDADITPIFGMMPFPHRLLRLPLRGAQRIVSDDRRYQNVILPYWRGLQKMQRALGGVGSRSR